MIYDKTMIYGYKIPVDSGIIWVYDVSMMRNDLMHMPDIGTNIEVVLDDSFVAGYLSPDTKHLASKTITVRGTVIATPKWMQSVADLSILNARTNVQNHIPRHRIISIGGVKVTQPKVTSDKIYNVTSSKTGETYIVTQNGRTKKWHCTCMGFQFHKKCRHVTRLMETGEMAERSKAVAC